MKNGKFSVSSQKLAGNAEDAKRPTAGDEGCEVRAQNLAPLLHPEGGGGATGGVPPFIEKLQFSHLSSTGKVQMVNVGEKVPTSRYALTVGFLKIDENALELLLAEKGKGDAFGSSRIAGIMAAKKTSDLIPLTHPLKIDSINVQIFPWQKNRLAVFSQVFATDRTGVEMEAMVATTVALLNLYDMTKAVSKAAEIESVRLLVKTGGKSGTWLGENVELGKVEKLATSPGKKTPKIPQDSAVILDNFGLEGDAHGGDWHRQVSLLGIESIQMMQSQGLNVDFGSFAENIATSGICLYQLPIGSLLLTSRGAALEVTQIGKECHTKCAVYHAAGDCVMPKEGIFAKVIIGGPIHSGDSITVLKHATITPNTQE